MRTSMPLYPPLIERYPVILYQGQFDFRDGVVANTAWIDDLEWSKSTEFSNASRELWMLDGERLAGYKQNGEDPRYADRSGRLYGNSGDNPDAKFVTCFRNSGREWKVWIEQILTYFCAIIAFVAILSIC